MRLKSKHRPTALIPTASMADIAFLLIVFFMVTISFEKDKTQVTLPETELRFEIPKEVATISITRQGNIRVTKGEAMSQPASMEDVLSFASDVVLQYPGRAIVLKADSDVPYEKVDKVLDYLKQARVELIYLLSDAEKVADDGA